MSVNTQYSSTSGAPATMVIKRGSGSTTQRSAFPIAETPLQATTQVQKAADRQTESVITEGEKQYFEELFPSAAGDIRTYSPYQRNGERNAVSLGTLIDVRG